MFNRQSIHIAMLLWGTIFCCIAALCLFMSKNFDREKRKWLLMMQVACAVLLFNDALAWNYRGDISQTGWYLVRISNFMVFLFSDLLLLLYHGYVCVCLFKDEALDLKIAILMSQIAPHFIYNTLSAIQALCEIDPMKAKETVEEFALYLRGNLNSLTEKNLIPFEQELEHVKAYLSIEQKRFGERVKVKYDIRENNFRLPPLTLQPLAENEVKHGLCKKDDGGTLVIQTWQEGDDIKITICDDGTGFDVDKLKTKSMEHIGIRNVRKRMKEMCNGTLVIESEPGKGTRVVLTMPRIL